MFFTKPTLTFSGSMYREPEETADQPSFGQIFSAYDRAANQSELGASYWNLAEVYDGHNAKVKEITGVDLPNPRKRYPNSFADSDEMRRYQEAIGQYRRDGGEASSSAFFERWGEQEYRRKLEELAAKHPERRAELLPDESFQAQGYARGRQQEQEAASLYEKSGGGFGPWTASVLGSVWSAHDDPVTWITAPLGFSGAVGTGIKGVAMGFLKAGTANAAVEASLQPFIQSYRNEAGMSSGVGEAATAVGSAFLFAGGLDAGVRSISRGLRRSFGYTPVVKDGVVVAYRKLDANNKPVPGAPDLKPETVAAASFGDPKAIREVSEVTGLAREPVVRTALDAMDATEATFNRPVRSIPDADHSAAMVQGLRHAADPENEPLPVVHATASTHQVKMLEDDINEARADLAKVVAFARQPQPPEAVALLAQTVQGIQTRLAEMTAQHETMARTVMSDDLIAGVRDGQIPREVADLVASHVANKDIQVRMARDLQAMKPPTLDDARRGISELLASPDYRPQTPEPAPGPGLAKRAIDDPYGPDAAQQVAALEKQMADELGIELPKSDRVSETGKKPETAPVTDDVMWDAPQYRDPDSGEALEASDVEAIVDMWTYVRETVPRKPQNLTSFLIGAGRLKDEFGEMTNVLGGKSRQLINNKSGMDLDDAALRAFEEGFFPERPDIATFLQALDSDWRGDFVFRVTDYDAVENWRVAQQMEEDLGRLGVDGAKSPDEIRAYFRSEPGKEGVGSGAPDTSAARAERASITTYADAKAELIRRVESGDYNEDEFFKLKGLVEDEIAAVAGRLPEGTGLRVMMTPEGIEGGFKDGEIFVSLLALDPKAIIRHEEIHALKASGLFSDAEWRLLVQAADKAGIKDDPFLEGKGSIREVYPETYGDRFRKEDGTIDQAALDRLIDEEAVAYMVQRAAGADYGPANGLVARVKEFLERLRNVLTGYGFRSVDDVLRAIEAGEVGSRGAVEWGPGAMFARASELKTERRLSDPFSYGRITKRGAERRIEELMQYAEQLAKAGEAGRASNLELMAKGYEDLLDKFDADLPRGKPFERSKVIRSGDFVVRLTTDERHGADESTKLFRIYRGTEADVETMRQPSKQLGPSLGDVSISQRKDGRWEVDMVEIKPKSRGKGVAKSLYAAVEAELGIQMHPSGILLPDGYAMWKKRAPDLVKYHTEVDDVYYSPRRMTEIVRSYREHEQFWRAVLHQEQLGGRTKEASEAAKFVEQYAGYIKKFEDAYAKVPDEAKTPEVMGAMFAIRQDAETGQGMRRDLDALGYYSGALEAAKNLRQAKGTPEQMLAMLKKEGAKDAEIAATGLQEFLAGKASVTKDEIVGHIEANRVRLTESYYSGEEVTYKRMSADGEGSFERRRLGGIEGSTGPAKWSAYSLDPSNPTYRETVLHLPPFGDAVRASVTAEKAEFRDLQNRYSADETSLSPDEVARMEGLRSVLLDATAKGNEANRGNFQSGHFSEPNIIGHMMTSMTKHEGKPVFTVDQIQSDWGQKLRDGGVRDEAKIAELEARLKETERAWREVLDNPEKYQKASADAFEQVPFGFDRALNEEGEKIRSAMSLAAAEYNTATAASGGNPLVNTTDQWVNTTLRRAIRQAAEANAEFIAVPSGDTVLSYNPGDTGGMRGFYGATKVRDAAKYEQLKAEVEAARVTYEEALDAQKAVQRRNSERTTPNSATELRDARKAVDEAAGKHDKLFKEFKALDAASDRFIDGIVPKNLRKLLQKIDRDSPQPVIVDKLETPTSGLKGEGFTLFPLTPKVKESVIRDGQTLFAFRDDKGRLKPGSKERADNLKNDLAEIDQAFQASGGDQRVKLQQKRAALLNSKAEETALDDVLAFQDMFSRADPAKGFLYLHESFGEGSAKDLENMRDVIANRTFEMMDKVAWTLRKGAFFGDLRRSLVPFVKTTMGNMIREAAGVNTGDATAKSMAKAWLDAVEYLRQRFNAAGGDIGKLGTWFLPQYHDAEALMKAGLQKWVSYMLKDGVLDRDAMVSPRTQKPYTDAELRDVLTFIWKNITTDGQYGAKVANFRGAGAMYKRHADHRVIHFKDVDQWMTYQKEFGGGDFYAAMIGHVQMMARDIAAMERFGANPDLVRERLKQHILKDAGQARANQSIYDELKEMTDTLTAQYKAVPTRYEEIMAEIGKAHGELDAVRGKAAPQLHGRSKRTRAKIEKLQDKLFKLHEDLKKEIASPTPLTPQQMELSSRISNLLDEMASIDQYPVMSRDPMQRANRLISRADELWGAYKGSSNTPADSVTANFLQGTRNLISSSALVYAPFSAVTDQATQMGARLMTGVPVTRQLYSFVRGFTQMDRKEALAVGLGLDQVRAAFETQSRMLGRLNTRGWTGFVADRTHAYSFLTPMTQASKVGFGLDFMRFMASQRERAFKDLPPNTRAMLERNGFTPAEWDTLRKATPETRQGVEMYTRKAVAQAGDDLAEKYMIMLYRARSKAVIEGTTRGRTAIVSDSQPGSVTGEALRSVAMLKSFPISYASLILTDFVRLLMEGRYQSAAAYGASIFFVGTLLGAVAMQLKNIGQGRDPEDMTNPDFWAKAFMQSGGAGIYGDFIASGVNRNGSSLAATMAGPLFDRVGTLRDLTVGNVMQYAMEEKTNVGREGVRALRQWTPGMIAPWYVRRSYERMILDELQKLVDPDAHKTFRSRVTAQKKRAGNDFFHPPGVPYAPRGPNWSAAFGQ